MQSPQTPEKHLWLCVLHVATLNDVLRVNSNLLQGHCDMSPPCFLVDPGSVSTSWTPASGDAQGQGCGSLLLIQVLVPGCLSLKRGTVLEGPDTLPRALRHGGQFSHVGGSSAAGPAPPSSLSSGPLSTRGLSQGLTTTFATSLALPTSSLPGRADSPPVYLL